MFKKQGIVKKIKNNILNLETNGLAMVVTSATNNGIPDTPLYKLLEKKWLNIGKELKGWKQYNITYKMGNIHQTNVNSDIWIMHCLFVDKDNNFDKKSAEECMKKLCKAALWDKASVHISGLLVQEFPQLVEIANKYLIQEGVTVCYYDQNSK